MALAPGVRLGAYEVLGLIGAGGMGEVYKARDTRLDRIVAIKILLESFAADPSREERFGREARAVAALNHPHICALHDVGEAGIQNSEFGIPNSEFQIPNSLRFLVMEYLEGQTLAVRLLRGSLPAAEVLRYGIEIADALDHAHRRGVVHRDLKPSNVMLTTSGAKLLDFGLSRVQPGPDLLALSTISPGDPPLTAEGTLLGTFPYMSPELLVGREADGRSDIFAFGAVVYEMTTGRRAFEGATPASVIGAILHTDPPPLSSVEPAVPGALDRFVSRCLAKDPDDRWQTARDAMLELKWIADSKSDAHIQRDQVARFGTRARVVWGVAIGMVLLSLLGLATALSYRRRSVPRDATERVSILLPPRVMPAALNTAGGATISPDGRQLAFVGMGGDGKRFLWVRPLDMLDARPLPTTEGAAYPFWSPDSRFIGFFAEDQLKRIALGGGPAQTVCAAPQPRGGAWSAGGVIVFSTNAGERWYRVGAGGGTAVPVTIDRPNDENYWPVFLPDGRHFIFFGRPMDPGIYLASLDSKSVTKLLSDHVGVAYAAPGYLLTLAGSNRASVDRTLEAWPFDPTRLKISGEPTVIAEHVAYATGSSRAGFSVSQSGRLVYETANVQASQLIWFARDGRRLEVLGGPASYHHPSLSPDGNSVAVERTDPEAGTTDIWLFDAKRGVPSRLTVDPAPDWSPVWSPDGSQVVFTSPRGTPPQLYQQDSRKAGPGQLLLSGYRNVHPMDWSSDGRFLVYTALSPDTQWDLWTLSMRPDAANVERKQVVFLKSNFNERNGQFSPDGRWIAYTSDESGTPEVYASPFPSSTTGRLRISTGGGNLPRWRRDGKELFYLAPAGELMAVPIRSERTLEAGSPMPLFKTHMADVGSLIEMPFQSYAVAPDGQRFLINSIAEDTPAPSLTVVLNWPGGIRN
jgi:eukaryotic-like serine/threonine-protein kinase